MISHTFLRRKRFRIPRRRCFSARPVDEQDDQEDSYGSDFSSDETDQEIDSDVDVDFADCDISPGGGEYSLI